MKARIHKPPSLAPVRFLPAPGSSYWAIQWPRIKLWVGQSYSFDTIQEWVCGVRVTAWCQPDGRLAILGDNLCDDYEFQYRFEGVRNHEWTQKLLDTLPPKSAVDAFITVPGGSRLRAMWARKSGNFEVWTMGVPYYKGKSLMWENPSVGIDIAKSMGLDTLFTMPVSDFPQLDRVGMRGKIDFLQREAIDQGVGGWMLKNNQGGSRFYVIKPTVSLIGKITGWTLNPGSKSAVASIEVSMLDKSNKLKPMIVVRNFPKRIPAMMSEMVSLGVLKGRNVEIRAQSISPTGAMVNPMFHRFAGRVHPGEMEIANFVSKFKIKPKI